MTRLIDADEVINKINAYCTGSQDVDFIRKLVENQATAYDVEKVVEELGEMKMRYFLTLANTGDEKLDRAYDEVSNAINKAIQIVRKGGVE